MRRKALFLSLFVFMAFESACVTVPNVGACSVAGTLSAGAICAETLTDKKWEMTLDEFLDFLEPQPERQDPADVSKILPARAGAICQSADDWNAMKTALEQACRELGSRCSYQVKQAIVSLGGMHFRPGGAQ